MTAPPIEVVMAPDALERLAAYLGRAARALVVMDPNTEAAAGGRVLDELGRAGVNAETLVFESKAGLLAGLAEAERVTQRLRGDARAVAVGSGVITDIVRFGAHRADCDFVSVPTAASMDGYASGVAALEIDGVKVTLPARPPRAIFADPGIAAGAPEELTRAGVGDLLAKASARVDWLATHLLYGEPHDSEVADRVLAPLSYAASHVEAVLRGEPDAVRGLLAGLIESGIAMALAGSSRPASGCEHHASHFWDLLAARGLRPHHLHGLQVGYATRFALRLQRFAFGGGVSRLRRPRMPPGRLKVDARRWLGEPSEEIADAVAEKRRFAARLDSWPEDQRAWERVRDRLEPELARSGEVERALARAGFRARPGYLDIDEPTLRATFRQATRLRGRYTTVDFLEGQGALEPAIATALSQSP